MLLCWFPSCLWEFVIHLLWWSITVNGNLQKASISWNVFVQSAPDGKLFAPKWGKSKSTCYPCRNCESRRGRGDNERKDAISLLIWKKVWINLTWTESGIRKILTGWQGYAACTHRLYVWHDGGPFPWSGSRVHCHAVSQLGRAPSRKELNSNREITTQLPQG